MKRLGAAAALTVSGLFGLFVSSGAQTENGYKLGLLLFVAATLFVFRLMKQHFDGVPDGETFDIWPNHAASGWLMVTALSVAGLVGLFVAATRDPYLYWFGLGLFVACCVLAMAAMARVFDLRDRMAPDQG